MVCHGSVLVPVDVIFMCWQLAVHRRRRDFQGEGPQLKSSWVYKTGQLPSSNPNNANEIITSFLQPQSLETLFEPLNQ